MYELLTYYRDICLSNSSHVLSVLKVSNSLIGKCCFYTVEYIVIATYIATLATLAQYTLATLAVIL